MTGPNVIVVGAGHNGLVAAILAAQAGKTVIVLERSDHPGGATVGSTLFPPHPARLSRYSYLIALLPDELIRRLGIDLTFASRSPRCCAAASPAACWWSAHRARSPRNRSGR
jgi:phytoene dehydrogenase-like protein